MNTIKHIVKKEFLQFKRDPRMFMIILIAPVIQLIFLGYAVNLDVENVKTIIFDQDKTQESRLLTKKFENSYLFEIVGFPENYRQVQESIENGDANLAIVIPNDFEKKIKRNESVGLQAILDASDGNTASKTTGYVAGIIGAYGQKILTDFINKTGQTIPVNSVQNESRVWYNPEVKTKTYMLPGIVGLLVSIITLLLTSLAIVKEKEIGTLEQIIVTPIKPYQLILGKLIPFTILGFAAIVIILTAMAVIFAIYPRGSILFLFFGSLLYILSTLGFGLFVSTISKTQQQAMMIAIFLILMPMVFLSGFAFPIENMPTIIQGITYLVPLRYFITIVRAVILKGAGLGTLWFEITMLFAMGATVLGLSSLRFNKKLE